MSLYGSFLLKIAQKAFSILCIYTSLWECVSVMLRFAKLWMVNYNVNPTNIILSSDWLIPKVLMCKPNVNFSLWIHLLISCLTHTHTHFLCLLYARVRVEGNKICITRKPWKKEFWSYFIWCENLRTQIYIAVDLFCWRHVCDSINGFPRTHALDFLVYLFNSPRMRRKIYIKTKTHSWSWATKGTVG